ncbi:hypothetical protein EXE58_01500 [Nocardioides seonyuensis]|uniref:DUF4430 domain-containing protein n=1 Tax=Nocardioides seonyuensis TaxID=2518371 RepID=A0A4P7IB55_9ACTN|nr:hypothetical protein [Nocardioides seonyuensis]QBX54274.1 hypothetical protein EXE58_01500 [Nocardioides seonyuensis]
MRVLRALAATALAAGGAVMVAPAPAGAATCSGDGVSVVVDYRELGGTTVTACAPDGAGKSAAAIFAEAGVQVSYASRQPGFVCRVNGVPTSDPCVNTSPTDAFWGLWWSDGARPWTYSSSGVGSLTVPAGGSIGWSWQQDREAGGAVPPGVAAPTAPTSSPSPSATSTTSPAPAPSPTSTSSSTASPTRSPGPTSSPTPKAGGGTKPGTGRGDRGDAATEEDAADEAGAAPEEEASATPTSAPSTRGAGRAKKEERRDSGASEAGAKTAAEPTASAVTPSGDATTEPAGAAGTGSADEPTRIPAALTWGVVALLGAAALGSAVVSRRRRGA